MNKNIVFELAGYVGNAFMKASNQLFKKVDVIHEAYYKENGKLVEPLS